MGSLKIGLTGGIGSGKSTVAAMLVTLGATLVDTDQIARTLTAAGGAAMPALEREFGPTVMAADGALDRAAMRALAFAQPDARRRLEAVLHPLIHTQALHWAATAGSPVTVFDVPLLTESSRWRGLVDRCAGLTRTSALDRRRGALQRRDRSVAVAGAYADAVAAVEQFTLDDLRLSWSATNTR
jgi:dephospho-CoA kinase